MSICGALHPEMKGCETPGCFFSHSDNGVDDGALPSSFVLPHSAEQLNAIT